MSVLRCLCPYVAWLALIGGAAFQVQAVPFSGFKNMEVKKSYLLGTLEYRQKYYRLVLGRRETNWEGDYRYVYLLRFWPDLGDPPYHSKKQPKLGTIVFFKSAASLLLSFISIEQANRHLVLPFIKAFCQFGMGQKHEISTTRLSLKQHKLWFIPELRAIGFTKKNIHRSTAPLCLPVSGGSDSNFENIAGTFSKLEFLLGTH